MTSRFWFGVSLMIMIRPLSGCAGKRDQPRCQPEPVPIKPRREGRRAEHRPRASGRLTRVLTQDHARRGVLAATVLTLLAAARPAAGQNTAAGKASPIDAPPPDQCMSAYAMAEAWVRELTVPPEPPPPLPGIQGASITLRSGGRILGRGVDFKGDGRSLWRAAMSACDEAKGRLAVENDSLRVERLRDAAAGLLISLELAGALIPISPQTHEDADRLVPPGIEGVACRFGDRLEAVFPGTMLVRGLLPGDALASAVASASDEPAYGLRVSPEAQPERLAREHGAVFYKFRSAHLAQFAPGEPPRFLFRGGRVVLRSELTRASIRAWADGLASHLIRRRWPGAEPLGMLGTAWPTQGRYEPQIADTFEQSLCGYALLRYAALGGEGAAKARDFAARLASCSAAAGGVEFLQPPAFVAMAWVFLDEMARTRPLPPEAEWLLARVAGGLDALAESGPEKTEPGERAVLAWALARRAAATPDPGDNSRAEAFLRRVYLLTEPGQLVSHMPWLGWAELALAPPQTVPAAEALRAMRDDVWAHQLGPEDAPAPDLIGGIVFTSGGGSLPTCHSARPAAFAASMLGDSRLTEAREYAPELVRLLSLLRFLRQLGADEATGHMYADRDRAMWGTRSSLWDQRQPPEASALTLLTLVETLRSLDAAPPIGPDGE